MPRGRVDRRVFKRLSIPDRIGGGFGSSRVEMAVVGDVVLGKQHGFEIQHGYVLKLSDQGQELQIEVLPSVLSRLERRRNENVRHPKSVIAAELGRGHTPSLGAEGFSTCKKRYFPVYPELQQNCITVPSPFWVRSGGSTNCMTLSN